MGRSVSFLFNRCLGLGVMTFITVGVAGCSKASNGNGKTVTFRDQAGTASQLDGSSMSASRQQLRIDLDADSSSMAMAEETPAVPGILEAENFDRSFSLDGADAAEAPYSQELIPGDDQNNHCLAKVRRNQAFEYEVSVPSDSKGYRASLRVAAAARSSLILKYVDDRGVAQEQLWDIQSNQDQFSIQSLPSPLKLKAGGKQKIQLVFDGSLLRLDWIDFENSGSDSDSF